MTSAALEHKSGVWGRLHRHVLGLWPARCLWVPVTLLLWPAAFIATGFGRWEHALLLVAVPSLAFGNVGSKRVFVGLVPISL